MKRHAPLLFFVLLLGSLLPSSSAQTHGQVDFRVTTITAEGRYSPRHVLAIWVTDDGVVVYLNGAEVARTNMHEGATAYGDWASSGVGGSDEQQWHTFILDPALLVPGDNLLAAELHQSSGTSSDIGFNLELKAGAPAPLPPVIGITYSPEGVTVQWDDGVLQSSPSLLAPDWQDMPGEVSPYTPPQERGPSWYRVTR